MFKKVILPCLLVTMVLSLSSWKKKDKKKKNKKVQETEVVKEPIKLESKADTIAYVIGVLEGTRMIADFERSELNSLIDLKKFFSAFEDGIYEKELRINPDSNMKVMDEFGAKYRGYMMEMPDTSGVKPPFDISESLLDSVQYIMGAGFGKSVAQGFKENNLGESLNMALFVRAMEQGVMGDSLLLVPEDHTPMVKEFFQELEAKQYEGNKKAGEDYLAKNGALENVTTTESGLQYEVITKGTGELPTKDSRVKVHYTGTLIDGTVFDSSIERGQPTTFGVTQVISGWTEALLLMPVGSKWKVTIPYNLAYGTNPRPGGPIEPYSVLIFEMELLEIE